MTSVILNSFKEIWFFQVVVLDTDVFFLADIAELWSLFLNFSHSQVVLFSSWDEESFSIIALLFHQCKYFTQSGSTFFILWFYVISISIL